MAILDLDVDKVEELSVQNGKVRLLTWKLQADIDNAEKQVFKEWIFLGKKRNGMTEGNK